MSGAHEQYQKYLEFQQEALAPARALGSAAAETLEQVGRQNYAVLGDFLEFSLQQMHLAGSSANAGDYLARQLESTRGFGELLARRTREYVEIASEAGAKARAVAEKVQDAAQQAG